MIFFCLAADFSGISAFQKRIGNDVVIQIKKSFHPAHFYFFAYAFDNFYIILFMYVVSECLIEIMFGQDKVFVD